MAAGHLFYRSSNILDTTFCFCGHSVGPVNTSMVLDTSVIEYLKNPNLKRSIIWRVECSTVLTPASHFKCLYFVIFTLSSVHSISK